MNDSILTTIKEMLGIDESCNYFDNELIVYINMALSVVNQYGVGDQNGYRITGATDTWTSIFGEDPRYEMIKSFVYLRVKLIYDPPSSAAVIKAFQEQIDELEFRIMVNVTIKKNEEEEEVIETDE